jgi:hypothetical protein
LDLYGSGLETVEGCCEHGIEPSVFVKYGKILGSWATAAQEGLSSMELVS